MIGYIAIGSPWSKWGETKEKQLAQDWIHRVHGFPHPTVFKTVRNAFRALRESYDYVARTRGMGVNGHVRVFDLSLLPILRFEDLSFDDRRAILVSKARNGLHDVTSEAMLQQAGDLTVPSVITANADELYRQLQVAERQMTIWAERCDKLRAELEFVKNATPTQKARRRRSRPRPRDAGFNAPEIDPEWRNATADEILDDIGTIGLPGDPP